MKTELRTPILVAVAALVVIVGGFFAFKAINSVGDLDQGQVKYTPGKPPWEETDASKKGPGGPPTGSPAAPATGQAEAHAPAGMGAPVLGNGK